MPERQWARSRIADWLETSEPTLVVTGAAGVGKSQLITCLSNAGGPRAIRIHAAHRCFRHICTSLDPVRILEGLAAQLARTIPGYAALLQPPPIGAERPISMRGLFASLQPSCAFDRGLRHPLEVISSTRHLVSQIVVVLDGLDEGTDAGSAMLAECFAVHRAAPVPGLRLLFTARPGPAADRLRGPADFDLTHDCPPGVDDTAVHLLATTTLARREQMMISAAARGNYLCADLAARFGVIDSATPGRADALYAQLLDHHPFARQVLSVLGRCRGRGLTCGQVADIIGAPSDRVAEVLSRWRGLLSPGLRLHHRCLAEYLSATTEVGSDEHDWLIARRLIRRWAGRWRSCRDAYALRHLLPHLADVASTTTDESRRAWANESVARAVSDPDFLTASLARVGADNMLSAMTYAQSRLPALRPLDIVASIVRGEASNLLLGEALGDPSLVAQQLMFQASSVGDRELSRSLIHCVGHGLLTMWATVDGAWVSGDPADPGHATQVTDAMATSAGTHAVTASGDGTLRLWILASGRLASENPADELAGQAGASVNRVMQQASTIKQHDAITAVAFNACGSTWISGHADGEATIWDLVTGEPIQHLPRLSSEVTAVAVSADGHTAATGSLTGDVQVWDTGSGKALLSFTQPRTVAALALTPQADRIIVGCDLGLTIHGIATGQRARRVARLYTRHRVTAAAVNPVMPQYVLFGTAQGQVAYVRLP